MCYNNMNRRMFQCRMVTRSFGIRQGAAGGKGYPHHTTAEDLPWKVRLLTILDVFDALTARDRPYKPAMPVEKALTILHSMADEGGLDGEILALFEESRAWEVSA